MALDIEVIEARWSDVTSWRGEAGDIRALLDEVKYLRDRLAASDVAASEMCAQRDRLADAIKSWSRTVLEDMGLA